PTEGTTAVRRPHERWGARGPRSSPVGRRFGAPAGLACSGSFRRRAGALRRAGGSGRTRPHARCPRSRLLRACRRVRNFRADDPPLPHQTFLRRPTAPRLLPAQFVARSHEGNTTESMNTREDPMTTLRRLSALALLVLPVPALGAQGAIEPAQITPPNGRAVLVIQPESRLWIEGTST